MNTRHDPDLAQRIILRAARKAPAALSARLEEEWLADLASRTGVPSRLRLAIGCCWATGIITREFRVLQLASSGAGGGSKSLLSDLPFNLPMLSRRTIAFIAIAGVHVLIIVGFTSGLAQHVITALPQITLGAVIENTPERPRPPPVHPDFRPTVMNVPTFENPAITDTLVFPDKLVGEKTLAQPATGPDGPAVTPTHTVVRALGGPGAGFPATADFYPSASRRFSETGTTTVQVCVDAQGRLTGTPTVAHTSGSARLDAGAVSLAKAGSGHYRPSTEDGTPVSACFAYRIRFDLN